MKKCIDCNLEKIFEDFPYDKSRDRYLSVCKPCTSIRTQNYRKNNLEKWKEYDKNRNEKCKNIIQKWKASGCLKCKEDRLWVLDAHHIDPSQKDLSIGDIGHGPNKLQKELEKCVVLCSNCHRDFHYQEKQMGLSLEEYVNLKIINNKQ